MQAEIEKKIIETFEKAFPLMSEEEKKNLLAYGEGMAAVLDKKKGKKHEDK